jgi:hypothetical protein
VAVKATFPPAGRICPAHNGLNYFNGISGDEPSRPRAKRARVPTGSVAPPPEPWRARSQPGPGCAAPSTSRLALVLLQPFHEFVELPFGGHSVKEPLDLGAGVTAIGRASAFSRCVRFIGS